MERSGHGVGQVVFLDHLHCQCGDDTRISSAERSKCRVEFAPGIRSSRVSIDLKEVQYCL